MGYFRQKYRHFKNYWHNFEVVKDFHLVEKS